MNTARNDLRNIAIIAHVDHGKTTLVDAMLRQSKVFRDNEQVATCVMDSNDLERERGITILSKNTAIDYNGTRINIVDTPGHSDFGGEVERVLRMVDGVLLLVDAFEGPMPQTRFVLQKALRIGLVPIIVINKMDRLNARPYEVVDEVLELLLDLDATEEQLDSPVIYVSGREGYATRNPEQHEETLQCLLDTIIQHIPPPHGSSDEPLQALVANVAYDGYVGRIAIGRVHRGTLKVGDNVVVVSGEKVSNNVRVGGIYTFAGLSRINMESATYGDIVGIVGISDVTIGDTLCAPDTPEALPAIEIDEPTLSVTFSVNTSPFAGREGTYVTSRHIAERLRRETENNLSLRVTPTDSPDSYEVAGRGELHLSILMETMRREGYEFAVSRPVVINKEIDGVVCEPIEHLVIDIPEEYTGVVMEKLGGRRARMVNMHPGATGYLRLQFTIPARGLIGYRTELLTDTKGTGIMSHYLEGYEPYGGSIETRSRGSLVSYEEGESITYGLYNAQERGRLFIGAGVPVYEGMVVGENARADDVVVNVCKRKQVTNIRASGKDDALQLTPPVVMGLEQSLEFIADDELIEVTPKSLRIRKRILNKEIREREKKRKALS